MCGIVGYTGKRPVLPLLLKGLKRLEYRGYDSAGVAYFLGDKIEVQKAQGKLENVEKILAARSAELNQAVCGIGHTRWATHGKPTTQNAHPHRTGHIVLVHNGIIENYQEIRDELISRGHLPKSETDSELFGFLVLEEMERGTRFPEAVRKSFLQIRGQCSVVVMSEKDPGVLVGVRNGSPLVAAIDPEGGVIFASDAQPVLEYAREVMFLENGDVVVSDGTHVDITNLQTGKALKRETTKIDWSPEKLDKQGFSHYMLKEIHEQPNALIDTVNGILDRAHADPFPLAAHPGVAILSAAKNLVFVACGTSWHAASVGKYWLERWARIGVSVELASEFRYRDPVFAPDTVVVGISQSGETADTLAVLREMKERGIPTLAVTNVRGSTISREADATFFTSAGPEIGVAATKTFATQMMTFLLWAGFLGAQKQRHEGLKSPLNIQKLFQGLVELPHVLKNYITPDGEMVRSVQKAAKSLSDSSGFFFIGRGLSFPIALEGALKLKEIAYVHAEGYAAGELKHGPIAMLDNTMTVVVLAPQDSWREKTVSNLEEVRARGAKILGVGDVNDHLTRRLCDEWVSVPTLDENLLPFFLMTVIQYFSFEVALIKGTDIDKPRNLAKSVTVE
jgi:glucosamine--fructose-6-phosphate aminotransferase (isomerizing)